MQQPCSRCGYVSDRPARFCRQCGAQLFNETETTSAPTRNYDPRQSSQPYADPQAGSWQRPESGFDDQTPETSRFYRPPIARSYPHYQNYPVPPEAPPKKSNAGVWILIALLSLLLVGGGMIGMVGYAIKRNSPPPASVPDSDGPVAGIPAPDAPPPPPPPGSDEETTSEEGVPTELQRYIYPKAEIINSVNVLGNQVVTITTEDEIKKIKEFYTRLIGSPMMESNSKNKRTLLFQTGDSPATMIVIEQDDDDPEKIQITLTRSPFVPQMK